MKHLASYFANNGKNFVYDMMLIGKFRNKFSKKEINSLPIIMAEYAQYYQLISPFKHTTNRKNSYSNHANEFGGIFDAAAIGQFLGGVDPIHKNNPFAAKPGWINKCCLFNPSKLGYVWERDHKDRLIPFAVFKEKKYRIFNLHIHSKQLYKFES